MAALSSTQSGNWSSSSTWGGFTPAEGDTFTINRGHKVTVNSDVSTTNGYGNVDVYGNLHFATGATIRFNGMVRVYGNNSYAYNNSTTKWFTEGDNTTAGLLSSAGNDIELIFKGANADNHGIWVENQNWASMKLEADEKKITTALSAAANINDSYLTVDSVSGFASGDWIAVYRDGNQDYRVVGDEGFWVHDVDTVNKRLYLRQYVSPTATILSASGTRLTVSNARVFRVGYKIIFGTGSNRNIKTITNIDYNKNYVIVDSSTTSAVTGETIYQTGVEIPHVVDDAVQKIATTLTTAVTANNTNQITVGDASDFAVGDTIAVDVNNDTDFSWDYQTTYTISSKSGNTLTLNTNLANDRKVGSIVQNLSRNMVIRGHNSTDSETRVFLYVELWTDSNNGSTRQILLKNVEFYQWGGNTNSTYYRGVFLMGRTSTYRENGGSDSRYQFTSRLQGCSIHSSNRRDSYLGFSIRESLNGFPVRNNASVNVGNNPIWGWSKQRDIKINNNYTSQGSYAGIQLDTFYEPYCSLAYNYITRIDDYALRISQHADPVPIRHNIILNNRDRPLLMYYTSMDNVIDRLYMDGYGGIPITGDRNGEIHFTDCYLGNRWAKSFDDTLSTDQLQTSNYWASSGGGNERFKYYRNTGRVGHSFYYDVNFQNGTMAEMAANNAMIYTDVSNQKWVKGGIDSNGVIWSNAVYVPAQTIVRLSCKLKTDGGSFSYPYLFAKKTIDGYRRGRFRTNYTDETTVLTSNSTSHSRTIGWNDNTQFTSAMKSDWEEAQLTIGAQDYPYMMVYGIWGYSDMNNEAVYFNEPILRFDVPPKSVGRTANGKPIKVRSTFTREKKRISGRI